MNCCYIFTIFCAILILALSFATSIEAQDDEQMDELPQADDETKQNLNTIVKPLGQSDENLLKQRRQTIDEMLTNYQIDAENEALEENDNDALEKDDSDEGDGGFDQNWLRQYRSQEVENEMPTWNKRHMKVCVGDKCKVGNQERFKSNPPLSEYKSLENFLSQTKLNANDILNSGISSYTNEEKTNNKENAKKEENSNLGKNANAGNRGNGGNGGNIGNIGNMGNSGNFGISGNIGISGNSGNNMMKIEKPYRNELLVAFNNRYNKPAPRVSNKSSANKKNNDFKFLEHNSYTDRDRNPASDYSEPSKSLKQFIEAKPDISENSNKNNQFTSQNNDDNANNNNKGSHSHHANYKPLNEETQNYLNKHHMNFDLIPTTTQSLKVKEVKQEEEDDLYAFKYPVGILRGTEMESDVNLTATVKPNLNYRSDLYEANIQQKEDQSMDTSLWSESDQSAAYMPYNDQLDNTQNNLSHEANYKLSKVEQDASEKRKEFKWKWGNVKRSTHFNPMDEIKLKTSSRLMTKGFGPSLPSYSLGEARRDLMIENVLKRKEKQLERGNMRKTYDNSQPLYIKPNYDELMERNKRLEDFGKEPFYPVLMPMGSTNWNYIRRKRISEATKTVPEKPAELKANIKEEAKVEAKDQVELNEPLKFSNLNVADSKESANGPDKALKEQESVEQNSASPEDDGKLQENSDNLSKDNAQTAKLEKDSESLEPLKDDNINDVEKVKQDTKSTQKREEMDINPDLNKDTNYHLRRKRSLDSVWSDPASSENLKENNDLTSLKVLKRVKRYRPIEALDLKIYQKFHSPKALEFNRYKSYLIKQNRNKKDHNKSNRSKRSCEEKQTKKTTTRHPTLTERAGEKHDQQETQIESKSEENNFNKKKDLKALNKIENNEEINKLEDFNLQSFTQKLWKKLKALSRRIKAFVKKVTNKLGFLKFNNTTLIENKNLTFLNTSFSIEDQIPEPIIIKADQADKLIPLNENLVNLNLFESSSKKTSIETDLERRKRPKRSIFENKKLAHKLSWHRARKMTPSKKHQRNNKNLKRSQRKSLRTTVAANTRTKNVKIFKNSTAFQMAKRQKRSLKFTDATDFDNFELNEDDFINSIERAGFKRSRRSVNSNAKENPPKQQRLNKRNANDIDEIFKPKFDMNYLSMDPPNTQNFDDFKPDQNFDFYRNIGKEKYPEDIFSKADTDFNFFNKKRDTHLMDNNFHRNADTKADIDFENIHAAFNKEPFDNMKQEQDPQHKFEGMKFDNMWLENAKAKHSKLLLPLLNAKKALHKSFMNSQDQADAQSRNNIKRHLTKTNLKSNGKINPKEKTNLKASPEASSLDKAAEKIKHNNLNDVQNLNQNYKFNENHYNWRHQPNIRNWLNSVNQEIQDSQNSDEANSIILSGRNEILNCKAFASLEKFLKSLPKNVTDEMMGTNREAQAEDVEKEEDAANQSETTTLCVPQTPSEPTIEETTATATEPTTTSPPPEEATSTECPEVTETTTPEIITEPIEPIETTTECIPVSTTTELTTTEAISEIPPDAGDDVKLNITINANVRGNSKAKNFFGNGTFNVMPGYSDDRKRREIFSYPYDEMLKQRCALKPTVGPHDGDDNNGINYLASGKLSANVVKNIFDMVRDCPKLKVLWPSLKRNQLDTKPVVQNLYAIRNQDNESKVKESEQLLAKAMESINAIIDEQVRSRTCVPLRPDLKDFYDLIIKSRQEQDKCRAKRDIAEAKNEEDFSAEVRLMDPNKIEEESKTVKKLLKQYEELPAEDQQEAVAVRDELLRDLSVLRKAKEFEERRKRDLRERKELELDLSDQEVMKRLETQYTPQFLKLLKAADLYREITSDTEQQL